MIQSDKKWVIQQLDENIVEQFRNELHISSIASKILVARGFKTAKEAETFLYTCDKDVFDPYLLNGMEQAVDRIHRAIESKEKILIYGDYDADGITSTTVLLTALIDLGADVDYCIPNRFTHGYGPHKELFQQAYQNGVQLIITVDNGISGIEPIHLANQLGMDVIVTDHHEAGDVLPEADVIIHPRVPKGHYPYGDLAGVGVAFKLAHALYGSFPKHLLEYVVVGTITDLVPLTGENRYFVKKGIEQLRYSTQPWIKALCEVSGIKQQDINEDAIGFYFGPRLNAIGRLEDAAPGVQFLMSEDYSEALQKAQLLNLKNTERKKLVNAITEEAIEQIEKDSVIANSLVLVVAKEGWNPGVIGIVASKLVEKYYKPTIVLSLDQEKNVAKGSGRSIEGFHLYNELAKNRDILPHFGGHPMAAGMTIPIENIDELRKRLHEQAELVLNEELLTPKLTIDVPVQLEEISVESIEDVKKLAPFGTGFSKPVFVLQNVQIKSMKKIGAKEQHLKLELGDEIHSIEAIGFNKGYLYDEMTYGVPISFAGDLQINEWRGIKKPQLQIFSVQTNQWQLFDYRGNHQHQLAHIPRNETTFIAFQKETINAFQKDFDEEIMFVNEMNEMTSEHPYLAILDLPKSIQSLQKIVNQLKPKRIYAVFYKENSIYFNGIPTRKQFAWYYSFLKKQIQFNLNEEIHRLANYVGLNKEVIQFMTNVFLELGFVKIENGFVSINPDAPKQSLTEASAYQQRTLELEVEQTLLYSTYMELRKWFNQQMTEALYI